MPLKAKEKMPANTTVVHLALREGLAIVVSLTDLLLFNYKGKKHCCHMPVMSWPLCLIF